MEEKKERKKEGNNNESFILVPYLLRKSTTVLFGIESWNASQRELLDGIHCSILQSEPGPGTCR